MIKLARKKFLFRTNTSRLFIRFDERLPKGTIFALHVLIGLAIIVAALLFLVVYGLAPYIAHAYTQMSYSDLGTYGDFFGSLTSLFTVLAFGGLIISLFLQRKDLELQRNELEESRKELKAQATAQEKQASHMEHQFNIMKEQFELNKIQVELMSKQSNLMKSQTDSMTKQIEMEMRPYLNAYIDYKPGSHALLIRNVGRSACTEFKMEPTFIGIIPEENKKYAEALKEHLLESYFDIIPAGMEYAIELDHTKLGALNDLYGKNISLEIKYLFKGLEKKDKSFIIKYNLNHGKIPTRRTQFGMGDICKEISTLRKALAPSDSPQK